MERLYWEKTELYNLIKKEGKPAIGDIYSLMKLTINYMDFKTKEEKSNYYRNKFYDKWGNYNTFLKNNPLEKKVKISSKKKERDFIYLKVHKTDHGDQLFISPVGTRKEFFLTDKKITMKKVKDWKIPIVKSKKLI